MEKMTIEEVHKTLCALNGEIERLVLEKANVKKKCPHVYIEETEYLASRPYYRCSACGTTTTVQPGSYIGDWF